MRKIKFRAWDIKQKEMLDWENIYALDKGGIYFFMDILSAPHYYTSMQYTGLKDKNGKEIYEGDIIRINHPYRGRSYIGPVIYEGYSFTAKDFYFAHHDNPSDPFESLEYLEVIGNIYEHPDLLK